MNHLKEALSYEHISIPPLKVLLVDDNADSLTSMKAILEVLGETILTATSGEQALKMLLRHDVAVIVTDVAMPGMDGFELASVIRLRERYRDTPIIFLTGFGKDSRDVIQGYSAGAADYLLKPCDPDVLRYKVKVFVDLAKKTTMLKRYTELLRENSLMLQDSLDTALRAKADLEREVGSRLRAEAARDSLAGKLAALPDFVEAMAEGALSLTLEGTVLYCNERLCEMICRDASEIIGHSVRDLINPSAMAQFDALLDECRKRRINGDLEMLTLTGATVPVQAALSTFGNADDTFVAMVVTDLRDQKRNEEILRDGKLARLIMQHSISGIAVCDGLGRVILASNAVHAVCGTHALMQGFDEILHLAITEEENRAFSIAEVLNGTVYKCVEVLLSRAGQRDIPLVMSAAPLIGETGETIGCVVFLIDISDRKLMEDVLRRSEKFAAAGRIAGTLAHEINNPLAAVTNIIFLLQETTQLDSNVRTYVDMAASELNRVAHIVKSTLSFYKESSVSTAVQVSEVANTVLDLYAGRLREKNIKIERRYDYDGQLVAFPVELRQLIGNLVANAIDILPVNGKLTLRIAEGRDRRTGNRLGVRIVVADNGPGIPREFQGKLFEPFFTTKGEKGTGLGLWVTESLVQKHRGSIRYRSSTDPDVSGTVFSVFIPFEAAQVAAAGQGRNLSSNNSISTEIA